MNDKNLRRTSCDVGIFDKRVSHNSQQLRNTLSYNLLFINYSTLFLTPPHGALLLHHGNSGNSRHDTECNAANGIEGKGKVISGFEEFNVFKGKRGKGGESATETDGKEEPHIRNKPREAVDAAIDNADEEASQNIGGKCSVWEARGERPKHQKSNKIAGNAAEETAHPHQQKISDHNNMRRFLVTGAVE